MLLGCIARNWHVIDLDVHHAPEESSFLKAQETLHYVNEDLLVECMELSFKSSHSFRFSS